MKEPDWGIDKNSVQLELKEGKKEITARGEEILLVKTIVLTSSPLKIIVV